MLQLLDVSFYRNWFDHWSLYLQYWLLTASKITQHTSKKLKLDLNVLSHREQNLYSMFDPVTLFLPGAVFQGIITVKMAKADKYTEGIVKSFGLGLTIPLKQTRSLVLSQSPYMFPLLTQFPFIHIHIFMVTAQSPNLCLFPTFLSNHTLSAFHLFSTSFPCVAFIF